MVLDRTSLYRALSPMERKKWIIIDHARFGCRKFVHLAESGADIVASAEDAWRAAQETFLEAFGRDNWSAMQTGLATLQALDVHHGR